jgi:hypothetical protein
MKRFTALFNIVLVLGFLMGGCAPAPTPNPVVVEKEMVVEKPVVETLVVEREVVVTPTPVPIMVGDRFTYIHNATTTTGLTDIASTIFTVTQIDSDVITFDAASEMKDGSQQFQVLQVNPQEGKGLAKYLAIRAGLSIGDNAYDDPESVTITGTDIRTYDGIEREVVLADLSSSGDILTIFWDRATGVLVEMIISVHKLVESETSPAEIPPEIVTFWLSETTSESFQARVIDAQSAVSSVSQNTHYCFERNWIDRATLLAFNIASMPVSHNVRAQDDYWDLDSGRVAKADRNSDGNCSLCAYKWEVWERVYAHTKEKEELKGARKVKSKCITDHTIPNGGHGAQTGVVTTGKHKYVDCGRLAGWVLESEKHEGDGHTCKRAWGEHKATFACYVFWFGKIKTVSLSVKAEIICEDCEEK